MGDSYYEYLRKLWLWTNKTEDKYKEQWMKAIDENKDEDDKKTQDWKAQNRKTMKK